MADKEDVCSHLGQRPEASGPPVKRFRGVDSCEAPPQDATCFQPSGPHAPSASSAHRTPPAWSANQLGAPPQRKKPSATLLAPHQRLDLTGQLQQHHHASPSCLPVQQQGLFQAAHYSMVPPPPPPPVLGHLPRPASSGCVVGPGAPELVVSGGGAQQGPSAAGVTLGRALPLQQVHISMPSHRRLAGQHPGSFDGGLWGDPQVMEESSPEGMDMSMNTTRQAPPLHWARKSQRQNRTNQRQQFTAMHNFPVDEPFPTRLSPPNFPWVAPEHHRVSSLLGIGRNPMERLQRAAQMPEPRRPQGMDVYPCEYEMDGYDLYGALSSMEPRDPSARANMRENGSLSGTPIEGARGCIRRISRRHRFRDAEEPRIRLFPRREESLEHMDNPLVPPLHGSPSYHAAVRERIRELDAGGRIELAREQAREQAREAFMRRRMRHQQREGRASYLGEEFGALMNALGLVPSMDGSAENSMMGIARSGLPPHLLFTDRDFTGDDYEWLCQLDEGLENRKGADEDTINKLQTTKFEDERDRLPDPNARCPICLEEFSEGDSMRVMPCSHTYHKDCLDKWLKMKAVCPICNLNIRKDM